jgi:hypothetical protein
VNPLDEDIAFWQTIEDSRHCTTACREVHDRIRRQFSPARVHLLHLERALSLCTEPNIQQFHADLVRLHRAAWRRDVWTAFELILGPMETIQFTQAISWLVLRGEATCTAVLADPDTLAELDMPPAEMEDASGIEMVARSAAQPDPADFEFDDEYVAEFEEMESELELIMYFDPPPGDPLPADLDVLRQRFPRITGLYFPSRAAVLPPNLPSLSRGIIGR